MKYLECPVLWKKFENDEGAWCFRLIAKFQTWHDAKRSCDIEKGTLASISSEEEKRFVTDEINTCG